MPTPIAETNVVSLRQALIGAIENDAGELSQRVQGDRAYSGLAPAGAPLEYLVLVGTNADRVGAGYFMQPGENGVEAIDCWSRSRNEAQELFRLCVPVLRRIPVSDRLVLRGDLSYSLDAPDRPPSTLWRVRASYRWRLIQPSVVSAP